MTQIQWLKWAGTRGNAVPTKGVSVPTKQISVPTEQNRNILF